MTDDAGLTCAVCGDGFPDDYGKHDPNAPVHMDDGAYHLGCEGEIFYEVFAEV